MTSTPTIFQFWGKANDACVPSWHPVVYHSLDVAAVAQEYLQANPCVLAQLARLAGLPVDATLALMTFLAGAHDVGKFGPAFQAKLPALIPEVLAGSPMQAETHDHQVMGLSLLVEWLTPRISSPGVSARAKEQALERLANLACAHHGRPVVHHVGLFRYHPVAKGAAIEFLDELATLTEVPDVLSGLVGTRKAVREFSWLAAGVITLADWVGSSRAWFPYEPPKQGMPEYLQRAREKARRALRAHRLIETPLTKEGGFSALFARADDPMAKKPTPLQRYADTVELADDLSPQLFILEDETGAGKTEAALTLASRLLAAGIARGVFFCLPTQTTANAVFHRIAPLTRYLFEDASQASISLAHGQASLALETLRQDESFAGSLSTELGGWAQERNKTALLADLGVGTIDQVVLAGLPARHASLRTLGLTQKVLIVDEAHACDTYQLKILCTVLEEHARLGGSVIILSATLPLSAKIRLATAFKAGLGDTGSAALQEMAYPLATKVSRGAVAESPVAARSVPRTLRFKALAEKALDEMVSRWLADGRCVCIIRNTVALAQEAYDSFSARYPGQVRLVHARFMVGHRIENDQRLLRDFGKASAQESRRGQLVIATQVVEASLDIDFDEMVTDLAPIDSLLQRAGRWRRHQRDAWGNPAELEGRTDSPVYVMSPDPAGNPFLKSLPKGTAFVYPAVDVLWRTARVVTEWEGIAIPAQVREAVEFAYDETIELPSWLESAADANKGAELAAAQLAYGSVVKWEEGYHPKAGIEEGERAVTRLGEPSVSVVLCDKAGGPLLGGSEALSQIAIRQKFAGGEPLNGGRARVLLGGEGEMWAGELKGPPPTAQTFFVQYSRQRGLTIR